MSESSGFLRKCDRCGTMIYMKPDFDGRWKPYESWFDGAVQEGEWVRHMCSRRRDAQPETGESSNRGGSGDQVAKSGKEEQASRSIGGLCDRLMTRGLSIDESLEVLGKAARIHQLLFVNGLDPLSEITEMFECIEAQIESIESKDGTGFFTDSHTPPNFDDGIPF